MSTDDDENSSSWRPPPKQLGADGKIIGESPKSAPASASAKPVPAPTPPGALPTLEALTTSELVLDSDRAPKKAYEEPGPYRDVSAPPPRRSWKWLVVGLVVVGAGVLAIFAVTPALQHRLPALPTTPKGSLVILSEPDGAEIKIEGKSYGQTPMARENQWVGEVRYEISARGYESKWGTFRGGDEVHLDVALKKK